MMGAMNQRRMRRVWCDSARSRVCHCFYNFACNDKSVINWKPSQKHFQKSLLKYWSNIDMGAKIANVMYFKYFNRYFWNIYFVHSCPLGVCAEQCCVSCRLFLHSVISALLGVCLILVVASYVFIEFFLDPTKLRTDKHFLGKIWPLTL